MFWSSGASGFPRRLLIVAAAALVPVLAGCEAGNNAPTLDWHYPTDGAGTVVGGISIRNVFVLGPGPTGTLAAGQSASLFFAVVNDGSPDKLLSVGAPGSARSVRLANGSIPLATNQAVFYTGPRPQAVLTGLTRTLSGGQDVTVVMNFQKAGRVTLRVPVMTRTQAYATYSPAPTATARKRSHHPASTSASPSPTASSTS